MSLRDVCSKKESSIATKGDVLEKIARRKMSSIFYSLWWLNPSSSEKSAKVGDHDKAWVISFNDNNDDPSSIRMSLTDAASRLNLLEYVFFFGSVDFHYHL